MLVSNAAVAQPEERGLPQQDAPAAKEVDTQQADAETVEPGEEPKNGLLFGFSHAFRLIKDQESASASRRTEHVYGFLFGYERVLQRYLALSIIKPSTSIPSWSSRRSKSS
ncbi:MAG: hypothetical protein OEN21_11870 [Myxococcales bacterium]|nr:hypothetical protein [Myxococcales bacterium]